VGVLLAVGLTVWLLLTADAIGFPRDEGFYFRAGIRYGEWFRLLFEAPAEALERAVIDKYWSYNHEHPSLIKSLFALSWLGLHQKWKVFADASYAFRLPGMILSGVAVWVTYLFGARVVGRRAGLVAAILLVLMPRVFFHAHLACFDIPVVAMWTLCIYVYHRSLERGGVGWALAAGVVFGLTLETKHNAWILPAVFLSHAVFVVVSHGRKRWKTPLLRVLLSLGVMAVVGPLVFWVLWPWMWHDTPARLQEYLNFHFNHVYYNMEFLGKNYFEAPSPRGYMPLMLVGTVPTITLLLFGIGAGERGRRAIGWCKEWLAKAPEQSAPLETYPYLLWVLALGAAISPWFLTKTPIFGGTKHWMTAYPFLTLFAAYGLERVLAAVGGSMERFPKWTSGMARALVVAVVLVGPLVITLHAHPFGLTSYVPLVGGTRGGASLGLNRQFWGYTTQNASEEFLAKHAPRTSSIFIHDTAWDSWARLVDEKRVRPDFRGVGAPHESHFAIVQHELHMNEVEFQMWVAFQTRAPIHVVTHDGVPVVSIYCPRKEPLGACVLAQP